MARLTAQLHVDADARIPASEAQGIEWEGYSTVMQQQLQQDLVARDAQLRHAERESPCKTN